MVHNKNGVVQEYQKLRKKLFLNRYILPGIVECISQIQLFEYSHYYTEKQSPVNS